MSIGCARNAPPAISQPRLPEKTCLVLSVGAAKGAAQLGAIEAIQRARLPIQCVVGNSVGALAGSIYASAPNQSPSLRFRGFYAEYTAATKRDATERAGTFGILAAALVLLSGGAALPALGIGAVAGVTGAASVEKVDHDRFVSALDTLFHHATIESLPVWFVTQAQQRTENGLTLVDIRTGNLASAVGQSIANPFVFRSLNVAKSASIDPGADRLAATPVDEACRMFPDAKLLVINVSSQPSVVTPAMHCPVFEIPIETGPVDAKKIMGGETLGVEYDRLILLGFKVTKAALTRVVWMRP